MPNQFVVIVGRGAAGIDAGFEHQIQVRRAHGSRVDTGAGGADLDHGRAQRIGVRRGDGDGQGIERGHGNLLVR